MNLEANLSKFRQWFEDTSVPGVNFARDIHEMGGDIVQCYTESGNSPAVIYRIKIIDTMRSHYDNSHAGALTTLVDWLTHIAGAADPAYWPADREPTTDDFRRVRKQLGLSRRLSLQYLKEVPLNIDVFVKCVMLENTKSRQYFTVDIFDKNNLYVRGTHDKIKLYKKVDTQGFVGDTKEDAFGVIEEKPKL